MQNCQKHTAYLNNISVRLNQNKNVIKAILAMAVHPGYATVFVNLYRIGMIIGAYCMSSLGYDLD